MADIALIVSTYSSACSLDMVISTSCPRGATPVTPKNRPGGLGSLVRPVLLLRVAYEWPELNPNAWGRYRVVAVPSPATARAAAGGEYAE